MNTQVQAIGLVEAPRRHAADDFWGGEQACIDIKPVMVEFLPRQEVRQPAWSHELMREYWLARE